MEAVANSKACSYISRGISFSCGRCIIGTSGGYGGGYSHFSFACCVVCHCSLLGRPAPTRQKDSVSSFFHPRLTGKQVALARQRRRLGPLQIASPLWVP